jgi:6,7-dimethyl-8-ribityllumazine synthase
MLQSTINKALPFDASNLKIGVVVARFNSDITEAMLQNLLENCHIYNINPENVCVHRVSGVVEIPLVLQNLAPEYDCLVAIGCVIRGDTPHFEYVCKYATEGVLRVSLDNNIPIGFGILTLESHDQSISRISGGFGSLEASLQTYKQIQEISKPDLI